MALAFGAGACDIAFQLDHIPDAPVGCPASYDLTTPATTTSYRLVTDPVPWADAAGRCAAHALPDSIDRTHLAVIANDAELEFVRTLTTAQLWIGLSSRREPSTYLWVTIEPAASSYAAWALGQPDNLEAACAAINAATVADGLFYDRECENYQFAFLCECDRFADAPARYSPL